MPPERFFEIFLQFSKRFSCHDNDTAYIFREAAAEIFPAPSYMHF